VEKRQQFIQAIILEISINTNIDHLLAAVCYYIQTIMGMNENNKFVIYIILGSQSFLLSPFDYDVEYLKKAQFVNYRMKIFERLENYVKKIAESKENDQILISNLISGCIMRSMCCIFLIKIDLKYRY